MITHISPKRFLQPITQMSTSSRTIIRQRGQLKTVWTHRQIKELIYTSSRREETLEIHLISLQMMKEVILHRIIFKLRKVTKKVQEAKIKFRRQPQEGATSSHRIMSGTKVIQAQFKEFSLQNLWQIELVLLKDKTPTLQSIATIAKELTLKVNHR